MRQLEIIHLRMVGPLPDGIIEQIQTSVTSASGTRLRMYRQAGISSDLRIHLTTAFDATDTGPTSFATRLAASLRELGLVEHSVWIEVNQERESR